MARYFTGALVALVLALASPAYAQTSSAEKAEQLNSEGKALFSKKDYAAAAQKFREAILFSPEGRFYFNLCYTLNKQGLYREAITACENVHKYRASNPLKEKADQLLAALREHVKNTSADPDLNPDGGGTGDTGGGTGDTGGGTGDTGGGTGDTGDTGGGTGDTGGGNANLPPPPPPGGVVEAPAKPPIGKYKWGIGFELGGVASSLGDENYAGSGGMFRGHADFIIQEKMNLGLQGYIQATSIGSGDPDMFDATRLEVVDIGGALYQHIPIKERLFWGWLGGLHIAILSPDDLGSEGIATLGGRGEASIHYLLGSRGQHVLTAAADLNFYTPARSNTASIDPEVYGLNKLGLTFGINVGYTLRFDTPFGSAPVFTLE